MICQCPGNNQRQELSKKLNRVREISKKDIYSEKKISVDLGAGQTDELDLHDLEDRERQTPEWKEVEAGTVHF